MSKAYTKEEMREMFLARCRETAFYWSTVECKTPREMCDGVVFSMLNIIDGMFGEILFARTLLEQIGEEFECPVMRNYDQTPN